MLSNQQASLRRAKLCYGLTGVCLEIGSSATIIKLVLHVRSGQLNNIEMLLNTDTLHKPQKQHTLYIIKIVMLEALQNPPRSL